MAFLLDSMLIGGIRFALDKLAVAVDQELNDDSKLREELLDAQMRVELGELSQEAFTALEDEVLARIREIRAARGENLGAIEFGGGDESRGARSWSANEISGIDANLIADDFHEDLDAPPPPSERVIVERPPVRRAAAKKPARKKASKKRASPRRR